MDGYYRSSHRKRVIDMVIKTIGNIGIKITLHDGKIYLVTEEDPTAMEFDTVDDIYEFLKPKYLARFTEELKLLKRLLLEV